MKRWLLSALLLVFPSCNWGYGAPVDRARFESAVLHEDGARCVFALHDAVYRPAEGFRAFPDGGIPRYVVDRHKLGVIDVGDGSQEILVDRRNRDWQPGSGSFHVSAVRGPWALIGQGGQRPDHELEHLWWRLDLRNGDLEELLLVRDLAAEGRGLGRAELAGDDFTLVLLTSGDDAPQEVWSRNPDGALKHLATTDHYYGAAEGQIWWYDVAARAGARTDLRTGATIRERRANFAMPTRETLAACKPRFDRTALVYQRKIGRDWSERVLPVQAEALR